MENKKISNRLFDSIYSFISSQMVRDNVDWTYADDDDLAEGYDENLIEFRGDSYDDDGEIMLYITREYYDDPHRDEQLREKWLDKAPMLELSLYKPMWEQLQDTFGDLWQPVFQKWFEDNYPEYPVNTYHFLKF